MRLFHMAIASGVFSMTSEQTQRAVTRNVDEMDVDTLEEVCQVFASKNLAKTAAWTTEPVSLDLTSNLYQWFIEQRAADEASSEKIEIEIPEGEWDKAFYQDQEYYPSRANLFL